MKRALWLIVALGLAVVVAWGTRLSLFAPASEAPASAPPTLAVAADGQPDMLEPPPTPERLEHEHAEQECARVVEIIRRRWGTETLEQVGEVIFGKMGKTSKEMKVICDSAATMSEDELLRQVTEMTGVAAPT